MHKFFVLPVAALAFIFLALVQTAVPGGPEAVVLQKDEGEVRTRRPREMTSPTKDFMLKITPQSNGSQHLVLGTEEIPPGGVIARHKHHGQDEILLMQTGSAHICSATRSMTAGQERSSLFRRKPGSA